MNRLFVARKPPFISSNKFLSRLKLKYACSSAGFSGTLDPFASGALLVAFGQYTKLFRFFKKTPKIYQATVLLGAKSPSLDIERIERVESVALLDPKQIVRALESLKGEQEQMPPAFSAKRLGGKRAYELARRGASVSLAPKKIEVYEARLLHYRHPFLTFEASVSEGAYIRVLAQDLLERLGSWGTLCSLARLNEGDFSYAGEAPLNPLEFLNLPQNFYLGAKNLHDAPRLSAQDLSLKADGIYYIKDTELRIIAIENSRVKYLVNSIRIN
ncbi:MAG: tRNA pseudouridine(55) synthase TruB [Helicobacteraceae bacterium]